MLKLEVFSLRHQKCWTEVWRNFEKNEICLLSTSCLLTRQMEKIMSLTLTICFLQWGVRSIFLKLFDNFNLFWRRDFLYEQISFRHYNFNLSKFISFTKTKKLNELEMQNSLKIAGSSSSSREFYQLLAKNWLDRCCKRLLLNLLPSHLTLLRIRQIKQTNVLKRPRKSRRDSFTFLI